jgi:flavin reductase (DIM6/NTAB) family NADH-FMN oxidoreductase RutF
MLGVCLSKKGLSGSLIESTGEFSLNIVGEELKEAALMCGRSSGRTVDKAAEYSIPLEKADMIATKLVSGSKVAFECKLVSQTRAGDHVFYIAEILAIHGTPEVKQLFAFDGYARLDVI